MLIYKGACTPSVKFQDSSLTGQSHAELKAPVWDNFNKTFNISYWFPDLTRIPFFFFFIQLQMLKTNPNITCDVIKASADQHQCLRSLVYVGGLTVALLIISS